MMTKVTTVRRQEAANMKKSTILASAILLRLMLRFQPISSATVVVSAANLQ